MNGRNGALFIADKLANLLQPGLRVWGTLMAPGQRLLRLSFLRSRTDGYIPVSTQFDGPIRGADRVNINIGEHCRFGHDIFFETCGGQITLGSYVRINSGGVLVSYASISIGNDCLIGEQVSIRDADHGSKPGVPMRIQRHTTAPIIIGDNVWIARGAAILKGVTIGSGAIVAANSVVNCNVPPNTIVGGVPAKVLKNC